MITVERENSEEIVFYRVSLAGLGECSITEIGVGRDNAPPTQQLLVVFLIDQVIGRRGE